MRRVLLGLAIAAISARAATAEVEPDPCMPGGYDVTSVRPRVDGVDVHLVPQFGLGLEWLRFQVARRVAALDAARAPDCVLDVASISVRVDAARGELVVRIDAADAAAVREVVRRARLLLGGRVGARAHRARQNSRTGANETPAMAATAR